MLLEASMLAKHVPVIGRVHHDRVLIQTEFGQRSKDTPDILVQKLNRCVIRRNDPSPVVFGEVTEHEWNLRWILRPNRRRFEVLRCVPASILNGKSRWRVRLQKADPERERLVAPTMVLKELDRTVGDKRSFHVAVMSRKRQCVSIQPYASRILQRAPGPLSFECRPRPAPSSVLPNGLQSRTRLQAG